MHAHPPYAIVVHGGAGKWSGQPEAEILDGVRRAAAAGLARLADGEPALEAVIAAVCLLEDNPLFNAGTGAALNSEGEAELMLRFGTTRAVCEMLAGGHQAQAAVATVLARMGSVFKGDVGLIAVDRLGRVGIAHNTPALPHAFAGARLALQARMRG